MVAAERRTGDEQSRDIVAPAGVVGGFDQVGSYPAGVAVVAAGDGADLRGGEVIGEAVAAQQQGGVLAEAALADFDEALVIHVVKLRTDIAEYLVAAGMLHRLFLGKRAGVFIFPHRRMVGGELADGAVPQQVEPRIAHMADRDRAVLDQRQGEHAGHPAAALVRLCAAIDAIVRSGNGGANTVLGRGMGESHGVANRFHCGLRGELSGCVSAHAIHHHEQAPLGVHPVAVLVLLAQQTGIGGRAR